MSFHISVEIEDGKLTAHTKNTQTLMFKCSDFEDTELYINFRDDVVRSLKERLKRGNYKVPACNIHAAGRTSQTLFELDHDTSENKIGEIVNLSAQRRRFLRRSTRARARNISFLGAKSGKNGRKSCGTL